MGRFSSFVDQIFNMKLFLAIAVACLVPAIKADATCEDCITFGTAMQGYLMSADSIAEQTELLVAILCPQAQDQAECDAAIRKYWEGIALAMYPVFLDANDVCAQLGVCKKNAKLALTKAGCGPDETECPAGCCPEANWYCCADNQHCAATAANCPFKNIFAPKVAEPTCEDCTGAVNSVGDVIESEAKIAEIMDFLKGDAYCGSLGDADCVAVIDALMPYAMPTLAGLLRERAAQFCCDLSTGGICC